MTKPLFENFFNQASVQSAIHTVLAALQAEQKKIVGIQKALPEYCAHYKSQLESLAIIKGATPFFPYLSSGLGNGALVQLDDGSIKYDFISGIGVHFSHSDPDLIKAAVKGALMDTIMQGNLQQHSGSIGLYELFKEISGFDHVFLTSSGVMGVENALKIAFHHKKNASRILSFERCFSGRSIAAAGITDKAKYRVGLPQAFQVDYVSFYNSDIPNSIAESLAQVHQYLERYPDQYACMMFELIQGEGGFNVGTREFFVALMDVLKAHQIPIYIDETQTFGHTTEIFAYQMFGLENYVDIVSVGKLSQTCATLYKKQLHPAPGLLSQTFTSSTVAIETAKVILEKMKSENFYGQTGFNAQCFQHFGKYFEDLKKEFPNLLKGPFGCGAMIAFEVFDGDPQRTTALLHLLFEKGVIAFINGSKKLRIRFLLPIGGVSFEDIEAVIGIIRESLQTLLQQEESL